MSYFPAVYQEWIRDVIGRKLTDINGLIYVFDVPDLEHPQQLQLVFFKSNYPVNFFVERMDPLLN